MRRTTIRAAGWLPTLMFVLGGAWPSLAQELEKPPDGSRSPTIYPAGPSWLTATAAVPTRIDLKWGPVGNTVSYRILRASPSDPEMVLSDGVQDLGDKNFFYFDYLPPRSGATTFSYKVYAVFVGTDGSKTLSAPSPIDTATALRVVAPPNLRFRVALSPIMGRLRVTLDWGAVAGATGYHVWQIPRLNQPPLPISDMTAKKTQLVIDTVVPGQGGTLCVYTLYEDTLKDDTVRSCVWVATQAT